MEKQPDVDQENVLGLDIPALALDERFGSLKFDNANKKLSNVQKFLIEAEDLRYRELLLQEQINRIDSFRQTLIQQIQLLQKFDLGAGNPKAEHDSLESRVDSYYNEVYRDLVMQYLPFLRAERRRENPQEKNVDAEIRKVVQLRTELEEDIKVVRAETEKIRKSSKEDSAARGERAATRLAAHFQEEVLRYETAVFWWRLGVATAYIAVLCVIGYFAFEYVNGLQAALTQSQINATVWISVGLAKLVFALALWYGLQFIVRNYNVNAHLAAVNRHRAAVASTLEDFIAVELGQEKPRLTEMLRNATEAMFKHVAIGYISKTDTSGGNPVSEIINNVVGSRTTGV